MATNNDKTYKKLKNLGVKGDKNSVKQLISIYLNTENKNTNKTVRDILKKVKDRDSVERIITSKISGSTTEDEIMKLNRLRIHLDRKKYIYSYFSYLNEIGIDINHDNAFSIFEINPLTEEEINEIKRYMVDRCDFDPRLFLLLKGTRITEVLKRMYEYLVENGLSKENEEMISVLSESKHFRGDINYVIRDTINNDIENNKWLFYYLDYKDNENQMLLAKIKDIVFVLCMFNKNKDYTALIEDSNILLAFKLLNHENIQEYEWSIVKASLDLCIESSENMEQYPQLLSVIKKLVYYDYNFIERILKLIYKHTQLYSEEALELLIEIKSRYAYREVLGNMLTTEERSDRFRYAQLLVYAFPEKGETIFEYAKELDDEDLLMLIKKITNNSLNVNKKIEEVIFKEDEKIKILSRDIVISEVIYEWAEKLNANRFYAATGFAFSSGLKMINRTVEYINKQKGECTLIIGALQKFKSDTRINKIDKDTVQRLNELIRNNGVNLYSFEESFYHGKFYFIGNREKGVAIIGSSNLSKTAYLRNYELDVMFEFDCNDELGKIFIDWFENFKAQCSYIEKIDVSKYQEAHWDSELDVYSERFINKMSDNDVTKKMDQITDAEIKYRWSIWRSYKPDNTYSDLGISTLDKYVLFIYEKYGLAVFESFESGNAYYVFKYYNDLERLLNYVSDKSKKGLKKDLFYYLNKGNHTKNKERLEEKIAGLFVLK